MKGETDSWENESQWEDNTEEEGKSEQSIQYIQCHNKTKPFILHNECTLI